MGLIPNRGQLFKGFIFDGYDSRDYGVYITGAAVYNAPARDVEMIDVPGRNGAIMIDRGRFSNITVTYPAAIAATSAADFRDGIAAFRNLLASRKGYCRLTDDYNPGEYREAVYAAGLDVDAIQNGGQFEITFECKPQRWLLSGQTVVTVASGGELENPTLFDASPLLMIDGYGAINLGADTIKINDVPIGTYGISGTLSDIFTTSVSYTLDLSLLNTGDRFYISEYSNSVHINANKASDFAPDAAYIEQAAGNTVTWLSAKAFTKPSVDIIFGQVNFTKGTASNHVIAGLWTTAEDGLECVWSITWTIAYNGASQLTVTFAADPVEHANLIDWPSVMFHVMQIIGESSKGSLGAPLYIDLELGEAYKMESGAVVSVNNAVTLPVTLPVLPPGDTTITYDNTVTSLEIIPRWWQV